MRLKMPSVVYCIPASREDGPVVLAQKAEKVFLQLGLDKKIEKDSFVAMKIHFGEKGNTGYIKPPWLSGIINSIKKKTSRVFLADTNTLYTGNRSNSVDHLHLASEHGFTRDALGIPVIIADGLIGLESEEVPVRLERVKSAKIASAFIHSDALLCLSHLTGHVLTGLGSAIKNMGMGCASRAGKLEQHSDVRPWINGKLCTNCALCLDYCPTDALIQKDESVFIVTEKCIGCGECLVVCNHGAVKMRWDDDNTRVQEKMAEYAFSVWQKFKEKAGFLNFLLQITKDCDCMSKKGKLIARDIGILGSMDPVALDKASVDLVLKMQGKDVLKEAYDIDWSAQLKHAEKIGLGTTSYELVALGPKQDP